MIELLKGRNDRKPLHNHHRDKRDHLWTYLDSAGKGVFRRLQNPVEDRVFVRWFFFEGLLDLEVGGGGGGVALEVVGL